jgi:hypothetical protein
LPNNIKIDEQGNHTAEWERTVNGTKECLSYRLPRIGNEITVVLTRHDGEDRYEGQAAKQFFLKMIMEWRPDHEPLQ